jgi:hypothetical protein
MDGRRRWRWIDSILNLGILDGMDRLSLFFNFFLILRYDNDKIRRGQARGPMLAAFIKLS